MIIWNGVSSDDVGVVVEHYPGITLPKRKMEVVQIPGRNGDFIIDQGAFENYEQSYQVFLDERRYGGLKAAMPKVANWLMGTSGYQRLEDSYFPDVYRMAYVENGPEFSSWFNIYGEGTLTFNCAPQKFYKIGEREIAINSGDTLRNPSGFWAEPILKVTMSNDAYTSLSTESAYGIMTFTTDGISKIVTIRFGTGGNSNSSPIIIDAAAHKMSGKYHDVSATLLGQYENMRLGTDTTITWEGFIDSVRVIPRWWTL